MAGQLYLVSTPIGNMGDITVRALKTLRSVDLIVAEDSRNTRRLLSRYRIKTPLGNSYYQGVEDDRVEPILSGLERGKDVALVCDSGTPLISDPGYPLVREAVRRGIDVIPVPGPVAAISALVASGLPTDHFAFDGMIPRKKGDREAYLRSISAEERTVIAYETPHRLVRTLQAIAEILPSRRITVARELTKLHEEYLRGKAEEILLNLLSRDEVKGEYVLVIEGREKGKQGRPLSPELVRELITLLDGEGITAKTSVKILAICLNLPRNEAYRLVHSR